MPLSESPHESSTEPPTVPAGASNASGYSALGTEHRADPATGPIGVFDSGLGGLSVLREVRRLLPDEDLIYFADSANCPYGTRPKAELRALAMRIVVFLVARRAKLIVVACNTASVAALPALRASFPVPFVGVVPAVKPAVALSRTHRVAVLATPATFQGEMFADLLRNFATGCEVIEQVCPGLVELVERGETDGPEVQRLLAKYLRPALEAKADTVVLGCTHYPFLRPVVESIVGPGVCVVDSGEAVARQVARVLDRDGLRRAALAGSQLVYYTSSSDLPRAADAIARLTGDPQPRVHYANLPANTLQAR